MDDTRSNDVDDRPALDDFDPWLRGPRGQAWMREHLPEMRRSISERRVRTQALIVGFVLGLASHITGYLLRSSTLTEPFGLLADLLYALGLALWTGVVLVLMVEVIPRAKERQMARWLDAYETALREKAGRDERPRA